MKLLKPVRPSLSERERGRAREPPGTPSGADRRPARPAPVRHLPRSATPLRPLLLSSLRLLRAAAGASTRTHLFRLSIVPVLCFFNFILVCCCLFVVPRFLRGSVLARKPVCSRHQVQCSVHLCSSLLTAPHSFSLLERPSAFSREDRPLPVRAFPSFSSPKRNTLSE